MEMQSIFVALLLLASCIEARPQDMEGGLLLAAAQVKQLLETGAAAGNEQSVEVLGQRMGGSMNFGFGDAMRTVGGRRRRSLRLQQTLLRGKV